MKTQLGHYGIVAELGRGGMGVVYKAFEPALDRYVAIKELSPALSHDPALVERFVREARSMAALNDPHIIQIHYIGQEGEQAWFAMEFVDGESLSTLIEREGPLATADALNLLRQAALGLATAHEHGVIHRDIKPGNLLLGKRGQLKIADFGIALTQRDTSKKLTATGDVVGTPGYLSPEVCLGKPVDERSDLFALGVVLFEMLSGRLPFNSESPFKLMLSVVESDIPDIRTLNDQVDAQTAGILGKLLAKEPDARYQTARELLAALAMHPLIQQGGDLQVKARQTSAAATMLATPGVGRAPLPPTSIATPSGAATPAAIATADARPPSPARHLLWLAPVAIVGGFLAWPQWRSNDDTAVPPPATPMPAETTAPDTAATASPVTSTATSTPTVAENPPAVADASPPTAVTPPAEQPAAAAPPARAKPETPSAAPAAPAEAMEKYGSVYVGEHNETVSVAQALGSDVVYIKVEGVNNPLDGQVIRTQVRAAAYEGKDYYFQHNGGDYVMLVMRRRYPQNTMAIELYLPGLGGDGVGLTYDAAQSKALDTAAVRAAYVEKK
ncbi:serine/threonine-protein kinase [Arenimonas oryziterrae]|uniref:non-specific serine/threonine protein kinase n=1 Tax=Arenimonas oryziterrae DSM 21050 = YC6267 TaxID=1121015 RepID=A0A091AUC6_9GAMM|nr:serine/threonine-protein kinase [Arenimonas oryziterrae]KFN42832.1 hypothetical protein N789_11925 [Arenimonas oryziterrae DSM 21050 = YC6267]